MLTFEQYIEKHIRQPIKEQLELTEASLGRLWQHYNQHDAIAIISSDRSDNTKAQNRENNKEIGRRLSRMGFGYNRSVGGYVETIVDDQGESHEVEIDDERGFIVYGTKQTEKQLFNFIKALGTQYKQESVLLVDTTGQAYWYYTNDTQDGHQRGDIVKLGEFHPSRIGKYFTKIGKKQFSFKTITEQINYKFTTVEMRNNDYMRARLAELTEQGLDYYDEVINKE